MRANKSDKAGLARYVGVKAPRVYELFNQTRVLSMYYIKLFILRGVFHVKDIYDHAPESAAEREEWEYLMLLEDTELQKSLSKALRGTLKREALLDILKTHHTKTNGNIIRPDDE